MNTVRAVSLVPVCTNQASILPGVCPILQPENILRSVVAYSQVRRAIQWPLSSSGTIFVGESMTIFSLNTKRSRVGNLSDVDYIRDAVASALGEKSFIAEHVLCSGSHLGTAFP
jgi:hypothetical protein